MSEYRSSNLLKHLRKCKKGAIFIFREKIPATKQNSFRSFGAENKTIKLRANSYLTTAPLIHHKNPASANDGENRGIRKKNFTLSKF